MRHMKNQAGAIRSEMGSRNKNCNAVQTRTVCGEEVPRKSVVISASTFFFAFTPKPVLSDLRQSSGFIFAPIRIPERLQGGEGRVACGTEKRTRQGKEAIFLYTHAHTHIARTQEYVIKHDHHVPQVGLCMSQHRIASADNGHQVHRQHYTPLQSAASKEIWKANPQAQKLRR
jgi:hypothetical protein